MTFDKNTLKGKTAVLAVTGSIAAYKNRKSGADAEETGRQCTGIDDEKRHGIHHTADLRTAYRQ